MISSQPLNAMQIKLMIAVKSPSPALRWRTQSCEFARPYRQCLHRWRCSQRYSGCRYGCVSDACHAWHFARRINGACDRQNAFALVFPLPAAGLRPYPTSCGIAPQPQWSLPGAVHLLSPAPSLRLNRRGYARRSARAPFRRGAAPGNGGDVLYVSSPFEAKVYRYFVPEDYSPDQQFTSFDVLLSTLV